MRSVWILCVIGAAVCCATSALAVTRHASSPHKARVILLSPQDAAVIAQNNSASGCAFSLTRGYGLRIDFAWHARPEHAVAAYHLVAALGESIPIVDTTTSGTSYTWIDCDAFVQVLEGWSWSVQALDAQNNVLGTAEATFTFAPCELGDGTPCS